MRYNNFMLTLVQNNSTNIDIAKTNELTYQPDIA